MINLDKLIKQIPNVSDDPQVVEIDKKISKFQELLKEKNEEFSQTSGPTSWDQSSGKSDSLKDAEHLIKGMDIESLAGPRRDEKRRDILRQVRALEKAVQILEVNRRRQYKIAVQQAISALPKEVKHVFAQIGKTGRDFSQAIESAIKMDELLNDKGIETSMRPTSLTVNLYFRHLLSGSTLPGGSGLASLKFMLDSIENGGK